VKQMDKKIQICEYCGYTWKIRVENPKECPYCKKYKKREMMNND
jgi:rubrerythrin